MDTFLGIMLIALGIFCLLVYVVGNVAETVAHKSPPKPPDRLEDLRLAYAPNIAQVRRDQREHQERQRLERIIKERKLISEVHSQYLREIQEAKIKRWLEGNPVTDENPLTKKEQPVPPYSIQEPSTWVPAPNYNPASPRITY